MKRGEKGEGGRRGETPVPDWETEKVATLLRANVQLFTLGTSESA